MSGGGAARHQLQSESFLSEGRQRGRGWEKNVPFQPELRHTTMKQPMSSKSGLWTQASPSLQLCHIGMECFWGKDMDLKHPRRSSPLHHPVKACKQTCGAFILTEEDHSWPGERQAGFYSSFNTQPTGHKGTKRCK